MLSDCQPLTNELSIAFNEDLHPAECFTAYLWETFQAAHAGHHVNKYELAVVRDYLLPLLTTPEHTDLLHRWYNSTADFHNHEPYKPTRIEDIPYFREVLLNTILPDTATMELIVTEYDIPDASYLLPILSRIHRNIPRPIIIEAIYELHRFAGEEYPEDPIPFALVPCTL